MSNQVPDSHLNRNASTRSNFTFAPGVPSNQASFYPGQSLHYDQENPASPRFNSQVRPFDIGDPLQNRAFRMRELLEKLNGGMYVCFKYFVVIVAVLECLEGSFSFVGWFESSGVGEFFLRFFETLIIALKVYALYLEYRAIDSKDYEISQKAVLIMQWYMVVMALWIGVSASEKTVILDLQGVQIESILGTYALIVLLSIGISELVFYVLYLFGALKVRNLLCELNKLLGGRSTAEPLL